ncbi:sigma-54 interaction domain-containing protein [Desulfitibacter alkalitolerans]|uniref:sigma-54 interaction domain-containing protein n=1 Tax=Desulfitibacter alkalitolerans TaxID=264641 RepID=UPI00068469AD|nr:sigma-54-dependent Fis family transcriptional regulator [Desulfitibacter alkalitolerans]
MLGYLESIKSILDYTNDAIIVVNKEGLITLFNKEAQRLTRTSLDAALGKHITEIIPNTRLLEVIQRGKPELNQQLELKDVTIITNRVPVRDENGSIIGAAAVFRDIAERIAMTEEISNLRDIQTLLEAIINSTQDAISVVDEKGIHILINPAYTRIIGMKKEELLNRPADVDIVEGESMHFKVLRTREPVRGIRMKVGPQKKDVVVNVAPMIVNDKLKGSVAVIQDISEIRKLTHELKLAKRLIRHLEARHAFEDIIGRSEEITGAIEQARRAAKTPATVLLRGESGTGKELFAHAIHNASDRCEGQFIRVNCAALTDTLLESELFGYVEGAFTGAKKGGHKGLFEEASGGTIFLDEIGEISLSLQSKLLRALQEKEIIRVGASKPTKIDVRIIAATNANLEELIQKGAFREDLYYRINVLPIIIPPLRHRKEDIPVLVRHLLPKYNQEYGRNVEEVSAQALEVLQEYDWPGNIRELENILARGIINMKYKETVLEAFHLPLTSAGSTNSNGSSRQEETNPDYSVESYEQLFANWERDLLEKVLEETGGNKNKAARMLGISIRSLYYKLEKHGIKI